MLGFITELDREKLRDVRQKTGGDISAAKLYELLIDRWLIFEFERTQPAGVQVTLSREARKAAVAGIEVEVTLGGVVEVRLLEHEGHAEHALPEIDRRLPVGARDRDVVHALALELPHRVNHLTS